jgi:hypothetical protein
MFEKHTTTAPTGDKYEKPGITGYYRIWETENFRYIDIDKYEPYLQWIAAENTPQVVDIDPVITPPSSELTISERLDALESAFLDDLLSRL